MKPCYIASLLYLIVSLPITNMSRLAVLVFAAAVCCFTTTGKSQNPFLWPERTDNTERAFAGVRDRSEVRREVATPNLVDQADLCFFLKDSEVEGHISCRLRYSRSKFNRNPFGLRFGKREWNFPPKSKTAGLRATKHLPYTLYIQERRV